MELIARYIESVRFDVEINVVSSLTAFIAAMESFPVYEFLRFELRDAGNRRWLASRICALLDKDIDPEYQNPHDTALAVYVHTLLTRDPMYFQVVEEAIMAGSMLWYAPKVLYHLKTKFGIED